SGALATAVDGCHLIVVGGAVAHGGVAVGGSRSPRTGEQEFAAAAAASINLVAGGARGGGPAQRDQAITWRDRQIGRNRRRCQRWGGRDFARFAAFTGAVDRCDLVVVSGSVAQAGVR